MSQQRCPDRTHAQDCSAALPGMCPKMPRTSGSPNHLVKPGMSAISDTQKDPSAALLTPSGVPGSLSMSTSLLPALGCGGRYSLQATTCSARNMLVSIPMGCYDGVCQSEDHFCLLWGAGGRHSLQGQHAVRTTRWYQPHGVLRWCLSIKISLLPTPSLQISYKQCLATPSHSMNHPPTLLLEEPAH